jgi:fructosamine-3-kinase
MRIANLVLDDVRPTSGGDICQAFKARHRGRPVFAKTLADAPSGFFVAEERGLAMLRVDGAPPVPGVVAVADDGLVLDWVEPGDPSSAAAEEFGRRLAALHDTRLDEFGAPHDGFIGSLPLSNESERTWPAFYVKHRILPYVGALLAKERRIVERLCERIDDVAGSPEPPARIHGDLWSGNLLWGADGAVRLVDAASAHGGHRETDLAMLRLFGCPRLETILQAYQEVLPLADGWQERVPLHQLHPLLVHATLFGGHYRARAAEAAATALAV